MAGPDVTDGVAALVGGAVDGVGGAGAPLVVGQRGVRLQSVADGHKAAVSGLVTPASDIIDLICCVFSAAVSQTPTRASLQ